MNKLLVVAFCVGTAILVVQSDHHTIYGTVDVDDALHNDTVLNNHLKCLLNMGKCSKESESFKQLLPEILKNKCAHCTENEKEVSEKFMKYMDESKKDVLKQIKAKYNP